jgi:CubicO group peptidase (beta-lactamase class C family)
LVPPWQARHGLTEAQYQPDFDSLRNQGYRPLDINAYSIGGAPHFASIWEQSPGPGWSAHHGLTSDAHNALFRDLPSRGFRPISISGYDRFGETRFASLWYQTAGAAFEGRHGMTSGQYQQTFDHMKNHGFRLVDVCGYTVGGELRFAGIWDKSPMPEWIARHNMTAGVFQSERNHHENHGFVLWRVSGYELDGNLHYAAIWVKGPEVTWLGRHGLSGADYQAEFNALAARGFRLVKVNGYAAGAQTLFAGIWHKPYLSDADETLVQQTVTGFMTNHGMPGGSVALAHEGRLVMARSYGVMDPATNVPTNPTHLFRAASVAKPITAVTVFRLIETGLLNLGDRVFGMSAILGTRFGTQPYGANIDQITVQHLLEHTSGWAGSQDPMFGHLTLTQVDLINHMLDNEPLQNVPGAISDYLNFGYCVLGRVIEEVTGLTYGDAVRQRVLQPCGISDMQIAGDTLADRRANEVVYLGQAGGNPYGFRASRMDAHGGWIASATDLVRFLVRVDGFATKPDILSSGAIATMWTPTTATLPGGGATGYAKGWATNTAGNRWHIGDFPGTAAIVIRSHHQYCWAALFNSRNETRLDVMRSDLDGLFWTIVQRITDWPAFDLF